jgi:hypothetical protein
MWGESTNIGWKNLRRDVIPENPATAILFPWKACQRQITWYFEGFPFSTQYCLARRTASSVASVPVQENHTRLLFRSSPGAALTMRLASSTTGAQVKACVGA